MGLLSLLSPLLLLLLLSSSLLGLVDVFTVAAWRGGIHFEQLLFQSNHLACGQGAQILRLAQLQSFSEMFGVAPGLRNRRFDRSWKLLLIINMVS